MAGRFFAIGSNGEAARLSGINLANTRICAYIITSLLASVAGVLQAARINAGTQTTGVGMEGDATVAALYRRYLRWLVVMVHSLGCVIGGLFMTLLKNGMNLLNLNANWQFVLIGIFLVISVVIDKIRRDAAMNKLAE